MSETKFVVEKEPAVVIRSDYADWSGDVDGWQKAYFQLLAWKNTWGCCYSLDILAKHDHSAYLQLVVEKDVKTGTIDMLKDLGYGNLKVDDIIVGTIDGWVDDDDIWEMFIR